MWNTEDKNSVKIIKILDLLCKILLLKFNLFCY